MGLSPSGDRWRVWASGRKPSAGSEDRGAGIGRESRRLSDKAKREDDPGPGRQRVTSGAGQPTPALGGIPALRRSRCNGKNAQKAAIR